MVATLVACAFASLPATALALGFKPATASPLSVTAPDRAVTGDFNGDGNDDLAVAAAGAYDGSTFVGGGVHIYKSNGDGTFTEGTTLLSGSSVTSVVVGNFTADTHLDLAAASSGGWTVFTGAGDGTFTAGSTFALQVPSFGSGNVVDVGDLNGDHHPDIATGAFGGNVQVALGNGTGGFTPQTTVSTGNASDELNAVAIGDFDHNGDPDLAAATQGSSISPTVTVLPGNGDGTFGTASRADQTDLGKSLASADLNGDSYDDIVYSTQSVQHTFLGSATAPPLTAYAPGDLATDFGYPVQTIIKDMNNDGKLDTVSTGFTTSAANVTLGDGNGAFTVAPGTPIPKEDSSYLAEGIAVGDFNGDGAPDVVAVNIQESTVSIFLAGPHLSAAASDLGSETVGMSKSKNVAIHNDGLLTGSVTGTSITGMNAHQFSVVATGCTSASIPANGTCVAQVTFAPTSVGAKSASLVVSSDSAGGDLSIPLSGTGIPPKPTLALNLSSRKRATAGKTLKVSALITNAGPGPAKALKLKTAVTKSLARKPDAVKIARLAAGKSRTVTIKVAVKKGAKTGRTLKVKVRASASGAQPKSAKLTAKIK
jgi:hypothetical protein